MLFYSYERRAATSLLKNVRCKRWGCAARQLGTRDCSEWLVARWPLIRHILPTKSETNNSEVTLKLKTNNVDLGC